MTKWEIGQELIRISDQMAEMATELDREGHKVVSNRLRVIRLLVGDLFTDNNDHGFGIPSSADLK